MARRPNFRLHAGTFDIAIAAFAAVAIGFAVFALPEWRLFQLLSALGLPDILSAAQPPLGLKARIATGGLFAALAFAGVYLLMRMLDRVPRKERHAFEMHGDEPAPIRLRRADAHPDNPARRPLIAGRELGEPFDELLLVEKAEPVRSERPLPTFLVAEDEPLIPSAPLAPGGFGRRAAEPDPVEPAPVEPEAVVPEAAAAPAPAPIEPIAAASPPPSQAAAPEPAEPFVPARRRDEEVVDFMEVSDPEPEFIPAVAARSVPSPSFAPAVEWPPEPQAAPAAGSAAPANSSAAARAAAPVAPEEESITKLMARLETGLSRRERAQRATPGTAPAAAPDDSITDRLRSAMSDLQKLAART